MIGTVKTTFTSSVDQRFFQLLAEHIEAHEQTLNSGQIDDIKLYKWHAGIRQGLHRAAELWQQAAEEVQKSEGSLRRAV